MSEPLLERGLTDNEIILETNESVKALIVLQVTHVRQIRYAPGADYIKHHLPCPRELRFCCALPIHHLSSTLKDPMNTNVLDTILRALFLVLFIRCFDNGHGIVRWDDTLRGGEFMILTSVD